MTPIERMNQYIETANQMLGKTRLSPTMGDPIRQSKAQMLAVFEILTKIDELCKEVAGLRALLKGGPDNAENKANQEEKPKVVRGEALKRWREEQKALKEATNNG